MSKGKYVRTKENKAFLSKINSGSNHPQYGKTEELSHNWKGD